MQQLNRFLAVLICFSLSLVLGACSGGGDGGPSCSFDNPATFATNSPWPKFRRDRANTGTLDLSTYTAGFEKLRSGDLTLKRFPEGDPKGRFTASPTISDDGTIVYIGSNDGMMYAIYTADWTENESFNFIASEALVTSGLVGRREGQDALFIPSVDGHVYGIYADSTLQKTYWPFTASVVIDRAPNLGTDGTIYTGSSGGSLLAVCPNAVIRFSLTLGDVTPVAIGPDNTIYVGNSELILRALRYDGLPRWSASASQPLQAAPVLELDSTGSTTEAIFIADIGGRVFKIQPNGQPVDSSEFFFNAGSPIRSSPALADGILYFGSDDGMIHAISTDDGSEQPGWPIPTGGAVQSSPAIARGTSGRVVVVGSNDGKVYFISDDDGAAPVTRAYDVHAPVGSSPAIDYDGNTYVGADDGYVYRLN